MKKENPLRNQSGSFGANESSLSRRGFLKRSGGATVAATVGWSVTIKAQQLYNPPSATGTESSYKHVAETSSNHLTWRSFSLGGEIYALYLLHQLTEHLPEGASEATRFDGTEKVTARILKLIGPVGHVSPEPPAGVDGETGEVAGEAAFYLRDSDTNVWYEFSPKWDEKQIFKWAAVHNNPDKGKTTTISRVSGSPTVKAHPTIDGQVFSVGLASVFIPKLAEPVTGQTVQAAVESKLALAWDENSTNTTFDFSFTWNEGTGILPSWEASVNNSTIVKKEEEISHDLSHTYRVIPKD